MAPIESLAFNLFMLFFVQASVLMVKIKFCQNESVFQYSIISLCSLLIALNCLQLCFIFVTLYCTVEPVLTDQIKQDIYFAFQTGGCLLLNESSAAESL